jgi:hypothetical protein
MKVTYVFKESSAAITNKPHRYGVRKSYLRFPFHRSHGFEANVYRLMPSRARKQKRKYDLRTPKNEHDVIKFGLRFLIAKSRLTSSI